MTGRLVRGAVWAMVAVLMSAPALADPPPPASPPARQKALDANQVICEKQEVVGSRLTTRRVCRTRAEWADLRLQDRHALERVQTMRGLKGP